MSSTWPARPSSSGGACARGRGLGALAHLLGLRRVAGHARLEQLRGALAVDALGVARPQGRGRDDRRALLRRERGHPRRRRIEPGGRHRGRHAPRVEHRDGRLPHPQRRQRLRQVGVVLGGREGLDGRLQRAGVLRGERPHRVLHAVAELREHLVRDVGGELGDEEDADALGPDQPHGLGHRLEELLGGAVEQQVRLVEEEDQRWACRDRPPRGASRTARPGPTSGRWRRARAGGPRRPGRAPTRSRARRGPSAAGPPPRAPARRRTRRRPRPRAARPRAAARRPWRSRCRRAPSARPCRAR